MKHVQLLVLLMSILPASCTRYVVVPPGPAHGVAATCGRVPSRPPGPSAFDIYMMRGGGNQYNGYRRQPHFNQVPPGDHVLPNGYFMMFDKPYGTYTY